MTALRAQDGRTVLMIHVQTESEDEGTWHELTIEGYLFPPGGSLVFAGEEHHNVEGAMWCVFDEEVRVTFEENEFSDEEAKQHRFELDLEGWKRVPAPGDEEVEE